MSFKGVCGKKKMAGAKTGSKRTPSSKYGLSFSILFAALFFFASSSIAEEIDTNSRSSFNARADFEYDDNLFQLTDDDKSRYDEKHPGDAVSNRYKDIYSISDYILALRLGLNFETDSLFEGTFSADSWVKYHFYERNNRRDYTEARIELIQSVGEADRIRFRGNFEIDYYRENDLSGANDANENGRITRNERIYSPSIYDEYEGIIAYRNRIRGRDKDSDNWFQATGMSIEPFLGLRYRRHDDPFGNRDRDIVLGGLAFDFTFGPKIDVDLSYAYEKITCPGNEELLLVDEISTDINGDGKLKKNAPIITDVDRSRDRQFYEIEITIDLTKKWRGYAGYRLRRLSYKTNNPIDVERYHQSESRHRIRTGVRWNLAKDWTARFEYTYTHDNSYDGIFNQNNMMLSVSYGF